MTTVLPLGAAFIFLVATLVLAQDIGNAKPRRWLVPAALSAIFAMFSIATVAYEGPLGFWVEHTRNLWGNQIWFDLLLAAGVAWSMLVPKAKSVGMRPMP